MHNQIREFPHLGCSTSTPPLSKSIFSRVLYIEGMNVWMLWGEYYRYLLLCIPYEDLPLDSKHISEAFVRFQNVFEFPQHMISKWTMEDRYRHLSIQKRIPFKAILFMSFAQILKISLQNGLSLLKGSAAFSCASNGLVFLEVNLGANLI